MLAAAVLSALLFSAPSPLRLDPTEPRLGDLVLVHVKSADPSIERGALRTLGLEFPLFRVSREELRAVVAVPIDIEPGDREVEILLGSAQEKGVLPVKSRVFDASELRVNREFTGKRSAALKARLRAEQKALDAVFEPEPAPPRFSGRLVRPVDGAVTGLFGTKRLFNGGTKSVHYGLDLDARVGTPVRAVQGGVIALSAMRWASGGTIVIDHGGGLFTAYFHLSKRVRRAGDAVKAGDLVGEAGRTGRVTGPHLHLAVIIRAKTPDAAPGQFHTLYVDPEPLLRLDFQGETVEATTPVPDGGTLPPKQGS